MTAMLHKVETLEGALLDAAVAKAEGINRWEAGVPQTSNEDGGDDLSIDFEPSSRWAHGGPIIEREGMTIEPWAGGWCASGLMVGDIKGPTILIAAMRAYVASKFGDTVELP